ncbi:putative 9-kDa protein b [Citrus virus B]|nr:putative 9-kDa protein b [Citrus virus B]
MRDAMDSTNIIRSDSEDFNRPSKMLVRTSEDDEQCMEETFSHPKLKKNGISSVSKYKSRLSKFFSGRHVVIDDLSITFKKISFKL